MKISRRFKQFFIHLSIILLIVIIELLFINNFLNPSSLNKKWFFLFYLLTISPVVLIYIIILFIVKLFFGKYRVKRGAKFQARLFLSFILVAVIPLFPLIFLTNNLINQTIEIWLTKNIEDSLQAGLYFTENLLDNYKNDVEYYLTFLSKEKIVKYSIIFQKDKETYIKETSSLIRKYRIDSIFIFDSQKKLILEFQNKKILKNIIDEDAFQDALKGKVTIKVKNSEGIEYIIGYSPIFNEKSDNINGILLLAKILPEKFTEKANMIASSLQAYKQMELYKKPLVKGITTAIVIVVALFIVLIAIVVSYFISKGITEPIKVLLDGTKNIASGNLDFEIKYNAKDEIKILINAFNQMTKEIRTGKQALFHAQRMAAWRDIARRIAHEIKNPLTPIRLSAERLKKKYGDKDFESVLNKSVDTIVKEVDNLKNLVGEFSEFARMPQMHLKVENLNNIIIESLNMFEAISNVKIETHIDNKIPPLNLDKQRIKEVILNIINNSIEAFEGKEGKIKISTYSKTNVFGEFVYLEIEDNGPGMPDEVYSQIFDPYFTKKKGGTGLGLSIVEKIITEHRGKIKCESQLGKGTKFIIEFNASTSNA